MSTGDTFPGHEIESNREQFMAELLDFVVEAGQHGWAAESKREERPQRPNFKELVYERGEWQYRDSYTGYFMAPGTSLVYYKQRPVWCMTYGGTGQEPTHFDQAKETYAFLRNALMQPEPAFPVRGPSRFEDEQTGAYYRFHYSGDLADGSWNESIDFSGIPVFSQRGDVGIIIDKDDDRNPVYPWDL